MEASTPKGNRQRALYVGEGGRQMSVREIRVCRRRSRKTDWGTTEPVEAGKETVPTVEDTKSDER
jgi:hypothetical protein